MTRPATDLVHYRLINDHDGYYDLLAFDVEVATQFMDGETEPDPSEGWERVAEPNSG